MKRRQSVRFWLTFGLVLAGLALAGVLLIGPGVRPETASGTASFATVNLPTVLRATDSATATPTAMPLPATPTLPPLAGYEVVDAFPHDPNAFTQGLVYADGVFYEGTGLYGESSLRRVDPVTGAVVQIRELANQYFGEGVTLFGDRLIQLTWREQTGFVYDRETFDVLDEFSYPTEGWGLTHDGTRLIMSDGTANLYFLDPQTFERIGEVAVRDGDRPVVRLNELEYVNGEVYANVWQTDMVARIEPTSGRVLGWIDLSGLLSAEDRQQPVDVLNGIAYDAENDRLFVTGKLWPKLFEIRLRP